MLYCELCGCMAFVHGAGADLDDLLPVFDDEIIVFLNFLETSLQQYTTRFCTGLVRAAVVPDE